MKRIITFATVLSIFCWSITTCKKVPSDPASDDKELIESAKAYFTSQLQPLPPTPVANARARAVKYPYWQAAYTITTTQGVSVVVPVFYQKDLVVTTNFNPSRTIALNSATLLVLSKEGSAFQSQLLTILPDSSDKTPVGGAFSGLILAETWNGSPLKKYKIVQGKILTAMADSEAATATASSKEADVIISQCNTIYGYNYSSDDPGDAYPWSEPGGCSYEVIDDPQVYGLVPPLLSSAGHSSLLAPNIRINPPTNVIGNIQDYLKCFSNYGGSDHTYQVSVCVDQPVSGSRQAWAVTQGGPAGTLLTGNPIDVGHTFLVLTESFSGYTISRNIGFYPLTSVSPWSTSAQGALNNDDGHTYDISLTVTLDNGQFFNILNYISQGNNPGYMYDLNTNNCTSFAIHALEAGDIDLPTTVGSWPEGGFGYDPGDLGEDIRNIPLTTNMTRSTSYKDHPNQYNCN